jgi:hypothetical protein
VTRTADTLPATARLFVEHLTAGGADTEGFTLVPGNGA